LIGGQTRGLIQWILPPSSVLGEVEIYPFSFKEHPRDLLFDIPYETNALAAPAVFLDSHDTDRAD